MTLALKMLILLLFELLQMDGIRVEGGADTLFKIASKQYLGPLMMLDEA